ncbi:hypothetical protein Tco_0439251 [Tanacetum coccineum]
MYDKGLKKESLHHTTLSARNRVNTYDVRITRLIADIENDIKDPVECKQTTPIPAIRFLSTETCLIVTGEFTRYLLTSHSEIRLILNSIKRDPALPPLNKPTKSRDDHIKKESEIVKAKVEQRNLFALRLRKNLVMVKRAQLPG